MTINYNTIPEFDKDFKRIKKKYSTLDDDFNLMKKFTLETYYLQGVPSTAIIPIEGCCGEDYTSNKIKKFSCKVLKGKGSSSGIRVIFVHEPEGNKITFIEIYLKAEQDNETRARLKDFLANLQKS